MIEKDTKILIIEDNKILAKNLAKFLELKGYTVKISSSIEEVELEKGNYDLLILDINLPGKDGLSFCEELRNDGNDLSIIILTSSNTHEDIIAGLEKGADDYISKPFDYEELIARIKAVLRRKIQKVNKKVKIGDLKIDFNKQEVYKNGELIYLSNLEYRLLKYLIDNKGKVIGRVELLEKVWGEFDKLMFSRIVDIYIGYLRKKLGDQNLIKTKKGAGYILE